MSVKTEQTNELLTFEQIDELAKEIYVGLMTNGYSANQPHKTAYQLAWNWFTSKNERLKLWNEFNNEQLKSFYSYKENRDNTGWYEPELEKRQSYPNDVISLNVQQHGKEIGSLEEGAHYWVIEKYNNSVPEIAVFDGVGIDYCEDKKIDIYVFERTDDTKSKLCIKAILPKKIEP